MKRASFLALALVLSVFLFLVACTNENTSDNPQDIDDLGEVYEPREGGTLNLSVTKFNTLNPLFNQNYSVYQLHHLVYESLLTFNENMEIEPLLAESWVVSDDGQSVDLKLRENIKWHDGEPFTSEDVIFTINLIKGNIKEVKSKTIFTTSIQQISDVREIEPNTIRITFTRPFGNALEVMTFPILPKHQFTSDILAKMNSNSFHMIGTGPYKTEKFESTRTIELVRNEQYWKSKPYIEKINVVIVPDEEAQLSLFENKEVDLAQPNSIDWTKYLDDNNVAIYEYVSNHFEFVGFNFKNFLLRDNNVRKAIASSINRHNIVRDVYLDHGTVSDVPINPTSWLHDDSIIQIGYDLNETQLLLEEGNFKLKDNSNIRVNDDGTPLKFKMILNKDNILREKKAYYIKEELIKIGIEIEIVLLDWEIYQSEVKAGNYDLLLGGWELSFVPDLSFAFHSTQIGNTNFIYYNNELMDELLQKSFQVTNGADKLKAYSELQHYLVEDLPYLTLLFKNSSLLIKNHVYGNIEPTSYNIFNKIEEWFIVE